MLLFIKDTNDNEVFYSDNDHCKSIINRVPKNKVHARHYILKFEAELGSYYNGNK